MAGRMWLANANYGAWVPCPSIEMPSGTQKWGASGQFLNGGAYVRRSITGARVFEMNWPMKHQSELDTIESFFEGAYGPGPFYVVEPGSMEYNMFPAWMAAPGMAATDGPSLLYNKRPTSAALNTGADYVLGAEYSIKAGDIANEYTLAIPADYTMWTFYQGSAAGIFNASLNGTPGVDMFGVKSWDGGQNGSLIKFYLDTSIDQTLAMYTMCAIVKPSGSGFGIQDMLAHLQNYGGRMPKGKGSTGMEVDGDFERTSYSAALDRYHGSVRLVEVEPWL